MFLPCPTQLWTRGHEIVQGHWGWDFRAGGREETPRHLSRGQSRKAAGASFSGALLGAGSALYLV